MLERTDTFFLKMEVTKYICFHRNRETEILKGQIDFLNDAINREEERAKELEMKSKYDYFVQRTEFINFEHFYFCFCFSPVCQLDKNISLLLFVSM